MAGRKRTPRGVVDTSVLIAGIAGFKSQIETLGNPSARLLREWVEAGTFVWLISEAIIEEYKEVMARLGAPPKPNRQYH